MQYDPRQIPTAGPSTIEAEPVNNGPSSEEQAHANREEFVWNPPRQVNRAERLAEGMNDNVVHGWNEFRPDEGPSNRGFGSEDLLGLEQLPAPEHDRSVSEYEIGFISEQTSLRATVLRTALTRSPLTTLWWRSCMMS